MSDAAEDAGGLAARLGRRGRRGARALGDGLCELSRGDPTIPRLLLVFVLFELAGIGWDLPGSYGWENDGAAPRDMFGGLANNLTPGSGHRYPLFHYFALALLTFPVLLTDAVVAALTGAPVDVLVVSTPSMTAIALISKLTNLAMMCVALLCLARVIRTTVSELAGRWAVLFAISNLSVAYYGRATNMDGPYLMWTALAIDRLLILAHRGQRSDYLQFAVFVAAGIATKDQAYASYVLTGPLYLVLLPLFQPGAMAAGRKHWSYFGAALLAGAASYALLSGALLNPTGFLKRLELLTGTNSQDWKAYPSGPEGWWQNSVDILASQADFWWPWPVVALAWLGVLLSLRPALGARLGGVVWRLLPLLAGISSTLAFTLVVGRNEHRFVLPLGFWLAGYAGVAAAAALQTLNSRRQKTLAFGGLGVLVGLATSYNLELLVTQWCDPRRDVERFLARLPQNSRVETYGLGVYLPRFELGSDSNYRVTHVRGDRKNSAPFLPGMRTLVANYSEVGQRAPDILVIPEGFAERFGKRIARSDRHSKAVSKYVEAAGALDFFPRATTGRLAGYQLLDVGQLALPRWFTRLGGRAVPIHGSTARPVWVLKRVAQHMPADASVVPQHP